MTRYLVSCFAIAASFVWATGCGGSEEKDCQCQTGCAGASGSSGQGGSAGQADSGANPNSIEGVWEFTGTRYGTGATTGIISLSADHFFLQTSGGGVSVALERDGLFSVLVTDDAEKDPWDYAWEPPVSNSLVAQRSKTGAFNLGAFPLDLSGSWVIREPEKPYPLQGCELSVSSDGIGAKCADSTRFGWMPDFSRGMAQCARLEQLPSMFGDLGGEWHCGTAPAGAVCKFRFEGATISSDCSNAPGMNGTMTITFDGDVASGQTSTGFEFSAKRN